MKKYNNRSIYYKDWTTDKLKSEAVMLDDMIYNIECFGTKDMIMLTGVLRELENRGITARSKTILDFEYNN